MNSAGAVALIAAVAAVIGSVLAFRSSKHATDNTLVGQLSTRIDNLQASHDRIITAMQLKQDRTDARVKVLEDYSRDLRDILGENHIDVPPWPSALTRTES